MARRAGWRSTPTGKTCTLSAADFHRKRPGKRNLDAIFQLEQERVVSLDWVVSYEDCLLQLARQSRHHAPAKSRVRVRVSDEQKYRATERLPNRDVLDKLHCEQSSAAREVLKSAQLFSGVDDADTDRFIWNS